MRDAVAVVKAVDVARAKAAEGAVVRVVDAVRAKVADADLVEEAVDGDHKAGAARARVEEAHVKADAARAEASRHVIRRRLPKVSRHS